jgi:YesN/AraC family two-component response regulator
MPRMTGLQLKEKIIALLPDMKFLLISGYAERVVEDSLQQNLSGEDFLEKPFLPQELARKVREILGRSDGKRRKARTSPQRFDDNSDTATTHG